MYFYDLNPQAQIQSVKTTGLPFFNTPTLHWILACGCRNYNNLICESDVFIINDYCKTRKFHLQLFFAISTDDANLWKLKASKCFCFSNDRRELPLNREKKLTKTFGRALKQWKFILAKFSPFTVYLPHLITAKVHFSNVS